MRKQKQEDYGQKLQESYDQWTYLYEHGGSDPFWEDGINLNLVRNHILYYRRAIEENMTPESYPDAYHKDLPPEVDGKYMARPDEIRAAAKESLKKYRTDPNYLYILAYRDDFTPKTQEKLSIGNILGYAEGLKHSIEKDDLVSMRRHENPKSYLKSFEDCVKKMKETPRETVQLSLFAYAAGLQTESDDGYDDTAYDDYGESDSYGGAEM